MYQTTVHLSCSGLLTHRFIDGWSASARAARHSPPTGARRSSGHYGYHSAGQTVSDAFEAVPFSNWSAGSACAWRDPAAVSFLALYQRDHREEVIDEGCVQKTATLKFLKTTYNQFNVTEKLQPSQTQNWNSSGRFLPYLSLFCSA